MSEKKKVRQTSGNGVGFARRQGGGDAMQWRAVAAVERTENAESEHGRDAHVTGGHDIRATDDSPALDAKSYIPDPDALTIDVHTRQLEQAVPRDRAELAAFVRRYFGLGVPDRAVCPNHQSPMDYLAASFFEQRDLLVWANRGGGKTFLAAVATLLDALCHGPLKISVLGGSFDQSDRLAEYIRELAARQSGVLEGKASRTRVRTATGSTIQMLAQSQTAVRGQHVQKIRCDEVDLFDPEVWRAVQFATRSVKGARGSIEVISTLHRSGGLMQTLVDQARAGELLTASGGSGGGLAGGGYRLIQWCLWEVIERCPASRCCGPCSLADDCRGVARNADGFFAIDDAIAIKARSSRAAWEAEMLCHGVRRDWLVFPEFSAATHCREVEHVPDWPVYRAIDFGYRNPLVCLWLQVSPGGAVHVLQEYVASRRALSEHAKEILARDLGPAAATYVDPAGKAKEATSGAACTDMLAWEGIPCTFRPSTIAEGLELIRMGLAPADGGPRLVIHPRCRLLREAFENYHYPPPDAIGERDKPVKDGPDHFIDALRYFMIHRMRPGAGVARKTY